MTVLKNSQNYDASAGPLEAARLAKRSSSSYESKKMYRKYPTKANLPFLQPNQLSDNLK